MGERKDRETKPRWPRRGRGNRPNEAIRRDSFHSFRLLPSMESSRRVHPWRQAPAEQNKAILHLTFTVRGVEGLSGKPPDRTLGMRAPSPCRQTRVSLTVEPRGPGGERGGEARAESAFLGLGRCRALPDGPSAGDPTGPT